MRIILQNKYNNYEEALDQLNLETLEQRREILCLKLARKCHKNTQTNDIFEKKDKTCIMKFRNSQVYKVNHANTKQYIKHHQFPICNDC